MRRSCTLVTLLASLLGLSACADPRPPLVTVPSVDLDRYLGTWYVIANIPYFLEDGKVATADRYAKRPDGRFEITYIFRRGSFDAPEEEWHGVAWLPDPADTARWKVRFLWPLSADYLIIDLDSDYRWAVVGHPSRDYFWILARDRHLDPATYAGILTRAKAQGYDTTRVKAVPQP